MITVSVVSHGHGSMIDSLVQQLQQCPGVTRIVVTYNIPERHNPVAASECVHVLHNRVPKGFGENHNCAFALCATEYFCVVNPDIELVDDPFAVLLSSIRLHGAAVVAPLALSRAGVSEDNFRRFPTLVSLLVKLLGGPDGRYGVAPGGEDFAADWVGGMFMLFSAAAFRRVSGFDERYFLYYEDVDICDRLQRMNFSVMACPRSRVIHNAQRASHRNWRHLRWHLGSMWRYLVLSRTRRNSQA